jgi:hypothetical protein
MDCIDSVMYVLGMTALIGGVLSFLGSLAWMYRRARYHCGWVDRAPEPDPRSSIVQFRRITDRRQ